MVKIHFFIKVLNQTQKGTIIFENLLVQHQLHRSTMEDCCYKLCLNIGLDPTPSRMRVTSMVEVILDKELLVKLDIRVIMETNTFQFLDILLSSLVKLEVERYTGEVNGLGLNPIPVK